MVMEFEQTNELGKEGLLQRRTMKPNLYRVAVELAKSENPYQTAEQLLVFIKSSPNYLADTN